MTNICFLWIFFKYRSSSTNTPEPLKRHIHALSSLSHGEIATLFSHYILGEGSDCRCISNASSHLEMVLKATC